MNLQVGVKVLLKNDEGEYLLLRRSQALGRGEEQIWDIPGGRIVADEPLANALTREVLEETGLMLQLHPQLIGAQDIFVESKNLHVVRLTYIGSAEGQIQLSDEHDNSEWMTKEQILAQETLDPYIRKLGDLF
ncbi:MAG TPA: NUDIX domain-containing protein [Candidatus Saccharibacteria bacterium]|nr:NUDIX domain-containing protein [Candidatus Saccharibacteria bacterium]HRK94561.1 NUDIX domain-containing protein [Candidatus Saccharibacteria bacterium]